MVVVVVGWVAATPFTIRHPAGRAARRLRARSGRRSACSSTSTPSPASTPRRTSRRTSGTTASTPTPTSTRRCSTATSRTTGCGSTGWSSNPVELDLAQLRALPHHEQITQHFCIQGWSGVAKWGGVSMQTIIDLVKPHARGEVGGLLLARRRSGQGRLLRRASDRADELPPHDARLRHERRAAVVRPRRAAAAAQRDRSSASSRSSGSRASSSSRTSPRSAAATAATTRTTSSSATGSRSEVQRASATRVPDDGDGREETSRWRAAAMTRARPRCPRSDRSGRLGWQPRP